MKSIIFELVSSLPLFGSSFDDDITSFPRDSTSSKDYIEEPNHSIPTPQVKLPPTPMSGVVLDSVNPINSVPLPSTDSSLFESNSESIKVTSDMKYVEDKASEIESRNALFYRILQIYIYKFASLLNLRGGA